MKDGDVEEDHQALQESAAGQHDPAVNAGEGRAMSLQDPRAPSLLGSLWDLVGSLG